MLKCPICENLYPFNYKKCIKCNIELVKEKHAPQVVEKEEVEEITPYAVDGDIDDFGGM